MGFAGACILLGAFLLNSIGTNLSSLASLKQGRRWYNELCMTRKEWEASNKYSDKTSFSNLPKLRSYLEEKNKTGLTLTGYENGALYFEATEQQYDYIFDTKKDLTIRLKKEGAPFAEESKDWLGASLKWYETSIALAAKHNLKPVAVVNRNILIYKRPHSEEPLPWENKGNRVFGPLPRKKYIIILVVFFLLCYILGFFFGRGFGRVIKDTLPNL